MSQHNVFIIMSDEHTRSVLGAYGNTQVHTPALDKLANAGQRFTNAYTPSPICISARASFATGTQVFEHRCWSSTQSYYGQHESWMHRLRARGSEVVSIGKLHYRSSNDDLGFTRQLLPMYLPNQGRGWPQGLQRKPMADFPEAAELAAGIGPGETSYTQYDRDITAASVQWLRQRQAAATDTPWVLFVSFICPHYPLSAPQEFYELYQGVDLPAPYDAVRGQQLKHPVIDAMRKFWNYDDYFNPDDRVEGLRNYYALCSFLDDNIGQVLKALGKGGARENTQVIYTSDHGDLIGNHGIWGKCYMYEDSVGIPMTLTGPDIEPGVNTTPVSLTDLASTIEYIVTGQARDALYPWQSRTLHRLIKKPDPDRPVLSEYHDGGSPTGSFMLRQGRWKYIYFAEDNPDLLFDMENDPEELNNLVAEPDYESIRNEMLASLRAILDPEQANRNAFSDQAQLVEQLGGIETIRQMASFNHTPVEQVAS
ncbi:MAG: sulfatase-like hydrolase/transferase [Gammaproteobacteria bacterium]|nr:sulfatase-like hydrolase/transferase [Gammaproteobacteria bacterium]